MEKKHRLTRSADFQRVYRQGKSVASRYAVLYYFDRSSLGEQDEPRLGLSVSKKVGGAVVRNQVKRVLKEAFRSIQSNVAPGLDYVIIARPGLAEFIEKNDFAEVVAMMAELLKRANLYQEAD